MNSLEVYFGDGRSCDGFDHLPACCLDIVETLMYLILSQRSILVSYDFVFKFKNYHYYMKQVEWNLVPYCVGKHLDQLECSATSKI